VSLRFYSCLFPQPASFPFLPSLTSFLSLLPFLFALQAFEGRAVLAKHKGFSMYRASAIILAQTITDFPIFIVQLAIFCIFIYFVRSLACLLGLAGLR
jgi:ATP-binding cassette subfamily G (WHITE) protein 2 (SNQ2)